MAHTLTFTGHGSSWCKVNAATVAFPYTLKNGDVITFGNYSDQDQYFTVNGERLTNGISTFSNTDIAIVGVVASPVRENEYTINYSEGEGAGSIPITTPNGVKLKTAGKYVTDDITVVPTLEEKSVTAGTSQQVVEPSTGNCGLKKVTVNPTPTETADVTPSKGKQTVMPTSGKHFSSVVVEPIPDDYVIPSGTQQITENGTYDVSGKASAVVNVPSGVEEVATASAMNALLVEENVGKYYKFTGTTDENFVNGDLYLVESGGQ